MPPRIPAKLFGALTQDSRSGSLKLRSETPIDLPLRLFSSTPIASHKSRNYKPRVYRDPWVVKRQAAKRDAVQAHRIANAEHRAKAMGDPIRGAPVPTPFVVSLATAIEPGHSTLEASEQTTHPDTENPVGQSPDHASEMLHQAEETLGEEGRATSSIPKAPIVSSESSGPKPELLNHFITRGSFQSMLEGSRQFSEPYVSSDRSVADPAQEEKELAQHVELHSARTEALTRILAPENASAKERLLINKRRIVEKFGRHNTDRTFGQNAALFSTDGGVSATGVELAAPVKERIGPDTGSSEVQIAILTAKIKSLADRFEGRVGRYDWVNKRNLRLLLHRRQKLLKYFEKKDRGGPRWRHLLETLGLTEATWKGEIELR